MPSELASKISTAHPSFTFYRHPTSRVLYFVFFSPDSAPVKVRMMHTMAIPGLLNVTAKEQGVHVDQKIEIHDMDDLVFEERDQRIGKFRSVYLLNEQKGTESVWEGMPTS
jgi:twinfilin-like protein